LLNAISNNTDEIQKAVSERQDPPSDNFQLLQQIVQSKIALDKNYKPMIQLDDAISRQIQVLFEKMEYDESDSDFYMQYYVPYFKACFTGGQFETLINHIFSSVNIPILKEYNKKHKKELSDFVSNTAGYFNLIRSTRQLNYKHRDSSAGPIWAYSHGELTGHGRYLAKQDEVVGPWDYYYGPGNLRARGSYNDQGKKEGPWVYYYFDGKVRGKELYQDGKQTGEETYYFPNGSISSHSWYKDGLPDGESVGYCLVGTATTVTTYRAGKEEGVKTGYFNNGDTNYIETYNADVLTGLVKTWYQNRKVETIFYNANGKAEGTYEKYYDNGQLYMQGNYKMDKQDGVWKYYYPNGQLKYADNFVNDKQEGEHKEYYDNGIVKSDFMQKHGKVDGDARYYDDDGKLYCLYHYENGTLQKAQYFDKKGAPADQAQRNHKVLQLTDYLPDGTKKMQALYNENDNITGTDTFYFPSGKALETDEYLDGQQQGPAITYYPDGTKRIENDYKDGKRTGYHMLFYSNGQVQEEGWNKDNDACGYWLSYNNLGKLTDSVYYREGYLSGVKEIRLAAGMGAVR
jgi:antitoxin component YwqK of YwqJK toxin-antitoxin module